MRRIDVPPGTVFGRLTVIGEAEPLNGRRMMLCQCECESGQVKAVLLASLRSGRSKSCGCWFREIIPEGTPVNRTEIRLYGKHARGRVALIDEDDFDLVAQYRWTVTEHDPAAPGRRSHGPYAICDRRPGGRKGTRERIWMHQLITGWPRVDHQDGNGLNNQRSNLRPATKSQNGANARKNPGMTSKYKGVFWNRQRSSWSATVMVNGQTCFLGRFANEEDAAWAYDAAAREAFGEFARTNFQDEPTQAMRADWQARRQAERTAVDAEGRRKISASKQEWWKERPLVTHVCTICGNKFQSNAVRVFYCSQRCKDAAQRQRKRERQAVGRLFLGARHLDRREHRVLHAQQTGEGLV